MASELLAFDIAKLKRNPDYRDAQLYEGLERAPRYDRFADAAKHIIRVIHSIPTLFNDTGLHEVEVYLGRAAATPKHVSDRWSDHYLKRHRHGLVALKCDTGLVGTWESAAVKVIKNLDGRGHLCVKNVSAHGQGRLPDADESCVYVTWRITSGIDLDPLPRKQLEEVAAEVAAETQRFEPPISVDQLRRGIDPLTRPVHERTRLDWHADHESDGRQRR